jgi:hypothetical protein
MDVRAEVELGGDDREALGGGRGLMAQAGDGVEGFLDALGDLALDRLGRGARVPESGAF